MADPIDDIPSQILLPSKENTPSNILNSPLKTFTTLPIVFPIKV